MNGTRYYDGFAGKSGRGPNGRLRNFKAMKFGKLVSVGRQVFREDNDPAAMTYIAATIRQLGVELESVVPEAAVAKSFNYVEEDILDIFAELGI